MTVELNCNDTAAKRAHGVLCPRRRAVRRRRTTAGARAFKQPMSEQNNNIDTCMLYAVYYDRSNEVNKPAIRKLSFCEVEIVQIWTIDDVTQEETPVVCINYNWFTQTIDWFWHRVSLTVKYCCGWLRAFSSVFHYYYSFYWRIVVTPMNMRLLWIIVNFKHRRTLTKKEQNVSA